MNIAVYDVRITSPTLLPNATQGAFYQTTVDADGGTGPYTFTATGLPSGFSITSGGSISGTTTQVGPMQSHHYRHRFQQPQPTLARPERDARYRRLAQGAAVFSRPGRSLATRVHRLAVFEQPEHFRRRHGAIHLQRSVQACGRPESAGSGLAGGPEHPRR